MAMMSTALHAVLQQPAGYIQQNYTTLHSFSPKWSPSVKLCLINPQSELMSQRTHITREQFTPNNNFTSIHGHKKGENNKLASSW